MLQRAYNWMMDKATHDHAKAWLAVVSFAESSFFPLPPDLMLIPMVLAQPKNWYKLAGLCTLASVVGGFFGYAIGYFAMDTIGQWLLGALGLLDKFEALKPWIAQYGVWLILIKGMTPIPYKLITITAGAFHFDLLQFTLASIVARGVRFFLSAALLWRFGEPIRLFIEKRLALVTSAIAILLVGGFAAVKLL